jgi:hypothetical protein
MGWAPPSAASSSRPGRNRKGTGPWNHPSGLHADAGEPVPDAVRQGARHRSPHPILADTMADEIVRTLDYDCARFRLSASPIINIAHRAKKLDEVALRFITRHPDAVALDLGAGLDTRMFRIAPPATVDWYDIDFPEVITAPATATGSRERPRHRYGPDRPGLAGRDPHPPTGRDRRRWPAGVPPPGRHDLPAEPSHQPRPQRRGGFNGYTRFAIWAAKHYHGTQSVADLIRSPGFDDPREPERWNPRLKLVREILLTREPEVAGCPLALRLVTRLAAHSAAWSRRGTTVLHYRF